MDRTDAGRVIVLLTTAFPTYPVDEATSELYVQALAENCADAAVGYAVVQDWIMGRMLFPKVAELLEQCALETDRRKRRQDAITRAQQTDSARGECACRGTRYEESEDEYGRLYVLPCRVCEPVRFKHWNEGHNAVEHDFLTCEWAVCKARAERGEKRKKVAAGSGARGAAADVRYEKPDQPGDGF